MTADICTHTHRQNNARMDELAQKVSALRGITVDIYDNARDHELLDNSVRLSVPGGYLRFEFAWGWIERRKRRQGEE